MIAISKYEKNIYSLRSEHPLVIPQIDPDNFGVSDTQKLLRKLQGLNVRHIAIGGSLVDAASLQRVVDIAAKDFDMSVVTYITNAATGMITGVGDKAGVYWAIVFNSENPFFARDNLVMSSIPVAKRGLFPLPTAYVFDERGSVGTANWVSRSNPIPTDHPEISLSVALAAEFLGMRFYIMAGGSNSKFPPNANHVRLLAKKTGLFVIPTSGIRDVKTANKLFSAGADAIHVGGLIERSGGLSILSKMITAASKHPGKDYV